MLKLNEWIDEDERLQRQLPHYYQHIQHVLQELYCISTFQVFQHPVDTKIVVGYQDIIQHPMSFDCMKEKILQGNYSEACSFEKDLKLIFDNCIQFNGISTEWNQLAQQFKKVYQYLWDSFYKEKFGQAIIKSEKRERDFVEEGSESLKIKLHFSNKKHKK